MSLPITDAEKTDIRRFCGYPAYGAGASGFQSWRFYQAYGTLEFRMNNLSDAELAVVRHQLAALIALEIAIPGASAHLDTDSAATWQRNAKEPRDRQQFLDDMCRRLCGFFGLPPGPGLGGGGLTLVV